LDPGARLHRQGRNGESGDVLEDFYDFCRIDLRLADKTAKDYRRKIRRFLREINKPPTLSMQTTYGAGSGRLLTGAPTRTETLSSL
jgi:site-specific recombinase XerD